MSKILFKLNIAEYANILIQHVDTEGHARKTGTRVYTCYGQGLQSLSMILDLSMSDLRGQVPKGK